MSTKRICFVYSGRYFWFEERELKDCLRQIMEEYELYRTFDRNNLNEFLEAWGRKVEKRGNYFYFRYPSDYNRVKEWLFLYYVRDVLLDEEIWIDIQIPIIEEEEEENYKRLAREYGEYRYDLDYGWKGVFAEDLIKKSLRKSGFQVCDQDQEDLHGMTNNYDVEIGNYKIDIKCATQLNYVEITPKVKVEQEKEKDFYIASKWFDDIKKIVIIGYFEHYDITNYQFKFLYGTPYWGVKLYDAKPIEDLFNKLSGK